MGGAGQADPALTLDAIEGVRLREAADSEQDPEKRNVLLREEWKRYAGSVVKADVNGLDPINHVYPGSRVASPEVAQSFIVPILAQRQADIRQVKSDPIVKAGIGLFDGNLEEFRITNESVLQGLNAYSTQEDVALAQMQMRKHEMPEQQRQSILTALGVWRQKALAIDPDYDIDSDPDYKRIVDGIGVGAGAGYFKEGPAEEADFGTPVGRVLYEGASAFESGLAAAGNAFMDLGLTAMAGLNQNDPYYQDLLNGFRAEAYGEPYVDRNGHFIDSKPRAQKATALANVALTLGTQATVDDIARYAHRVAETDQIMRARERGELENSASAITMSLGSLGAFVATGGGKLMTGGAQLVTRGKMGAAMLIGAKEGTRLHRTAAFFRQGLGQGVGYGVHEALLYGRTEGYGKAFVHALPMGLVFAAAGRMGKASEKLLATRARMPAFVSKFVAGAIEGVALTPAMAMEMESSLWNFMRDPSRATSGNLMRDVMASAISFGIFKGLTGRTPFEVRDMERALAEHREFNEAWAKARVFEEKREAYKEDPLTVVAREVAKRGLERDARVRRAAGEAERRVVDYDQLTEVERRGVEADRRKGKPRSFNQRMERVSQLTDPLERTDYLDLPEPVRQRIEAAQDANQRKLIWFQHYVQGSGDRRQGERRVGAPEVVPPRPLSPEQAKQVREALKGMPGVERLAETIGTEPRAYTRGERDVILNALRARLTRLENEHLRHQLREKEPWHRGVKKDAFKGATIKERLRKIRALKEALRRIQSKPGVVRHERGPTPPQFTPEQAATLDRLLGRGTVASVSGPHLRPVRDALAKQVYEKIQELRRVELRAQLAGRSSTLKAARRQIRDLIGALREIEVRGHQDVIEEAGLRDEPGMPDVPMIEPSKISLEQLKGSVERGEFEPFGGREEMVYEPGATAYFDAAREAGSGPPTKGLKNATLLKLARAEEQGHPEAAKAIKNIDAWMREQRYGTRQRDEIAEAKAEEWRQREKAKQAERTAREIEDEGAAETTEEMVLRAAREGEIKPGTHEEMFLDRVEAQRASDEVDAVLGARVGPEPIPGMPKSLQLVPQRVMEPARPDVPDTRMSDVMASLEGRADDPVQMRLRPRTGIEGERLGESTLAFYRPSEHQARFRQPNAIIVASHEQAHGMDNRIQARGEWRPDASTDIPDKLYEDLMIAADTYPGIKDAYAKSILIREALDAGVLPDGSPISPEVIAKLEQAEIKLKNFVQSEGFAEFWSRYRLEDPRLQEEVPALYNFMVHDLMARPAMKPFMDQVEYSRRILANYRDEGAEKRGEMGRVMESDKPTEVEREFRGGPLRRLWRGFIQAGLDDLSEAKLAWNKWVKASKMGVESPLAIPITMDPIRMVEANKMTAYQMAQRSVHMGTFDLFGNRTGEGLVPILKAVGEGIESKPLRDDEYRRFWNYFVAARSLDLIEFPRRKAHDEAYDRAYKQAIKEGADEAEASEAGKQAGEFARERAKVPDTGFNEQDAQFIVDKYDVAGKGEKWRPIMTRVREWTLRNLDYAVEAGAIREQDRDNVANAYEVYLPFKRVIATPGEGVEIDAARPGVGVTERGKALRGYKGANWEIEDPLKVLRDQAYDIIQKTQHHMATQAIYLNNKILNPRLIANKQAPLGSFASQVARDAEPRTVFIDQMAKEMLNEAKNRGMDLSEADREAYVAEARKIASDMVRLFGDEGAAIQFWFPLTAYKGKEPIIPFRPNVPESFMDELNLSPKERKILNAEKGKVLWLQVDDTFFNALMTIDAPRTLIDNAPPLVNAALTIPSKMVRSGATVLSPAFAIRNIARDLATAVVFKRGKEHYNLFNAMADAVRAAKAQHQEAPLYQRYANLGLEGASIYGTEFQRDFHRAANQFMRGAQKLHQTIGQFLSKPESWHRFTEFKDVEQKVLEAGGTRMDAQLEAMLAAKEITTNFTRAGHVSRALNQLVPYFAPNLAGKRKLYRVMTGAEGKEAQAAFYTRAFANIGGMTLAVIAWNRLYGDDSWREDLPQWQRDAYWNLKMPGGYVLKIPKPFELGQIFGTSIEALHDALRYERGGDTARASFISFLEDQRDSVTNAYKLAPILPFIEVIANHSFFKERDLVPEWMEKSRLPEDQYTRYTSESAKALGSFFGISPIKIEAFLGGYTGGMATAIARSAESSFGAIAEGDVGGAIAGVARPFLSRQHELGAYGDAIYKWSDQLNRLSGSRQITPLQESMRPHIARVKSRITRIRETVKDPGEADRMVYALAKPIIDKLGSLEP